MLTPTSSDPRFSARLLEKFPGRVLFDEPMAKHVAWQVGGPAEILIFPDTEEELLWLADEARTRGMAITILGGGTNVLISDQGIQGITLSITRGFQGIQVIRRNEEATWVQAGAGVAKKELLDWSVENGLSGLEFSSGIPGTVGGGIFMNAGTKYGTYGDIIDQVRIFDFKSGPKAVDKSCISFGYRSQTALRTGVVTSVTFRLNAASSESVAGTIQRIIEERRAKQPLDFPSCGSTFRNPEGLSAGRLIEKAGLKGTRIGGAEISLQHANFILNTGTATAEDIENLIQLAKSRVKALCNVDLDCEIIRLGPSGTIIS